MGRVAATVWAIAGALVLLAALVEIPGRLREISAGYGVRDARTLLVGCAIGIAAGLLALLGARRAWRRKPSVWLALPAMLLAAGAVHAGVSTGHVERTLGFVPLLASPYGVWFLPPMLVWGGLSTVAVWAVDSRASRR